MQLSVVSLAFCFALPLAAQSSPAPEPLCGRDILTVGDAWENVQVERYEFERVAGALATAHGRPGLAFAVHGTAGAVAPGAA